MRALLAAAQDARVHYVVVDERGRVEELDGAAGGERLARLAAHRLAGQHGHGGPGPSSPSGNELVEDVVKIAAERAVPRDHVQILVELPVDLRGHPKQVIRETIRHP